MPERMKRCPNMDCEDLGLRVPKDHACRPYDPDADDPEFPDQPGYGIGNPETGWTGL